ncbi:tetratricopeptide repeat protein [bacterium]|nr:tetratricopeptide repeat protein [bacterium]
MAETPSQLFQAGRLQDAVAAATLAVKAKPADADRRGLLAEFLMFAGALERADAQLDALSTQTPDAAVSLALIRQQIRGEQARRQLFTDGRIPELLDAPPPDHLRLKLEAIVHLREGRLGEALAACVQAEELRPPLAGTHDDAAFDDFRDLDDVFGGLFEVVTSTGKYFWIPAERVERIEFHPAQKPRDLIWRRASMTVRNGPDGEVFIPAIYPGLAADAADALLLGRATEWTEDQNAPVRGAGQRSFLVGEECLPIMQLGTLTFTPNA